MSDQREVLPRTERPPTTIGDIERTLSVSFFSPYSERLRRKTLEERNRFLAAIRAYIEEKERIEQAVVNYERSLVAVRNLDAIRRTEALKINAELERQELEAFDGLEIAKLKMLLTKLEMEYKVLEAQERLDNRRNPPPPPSPPPKEVPIDHNMEALKEMFAGGGKHTRAAKRFRDQLIRERGGEDKLTPQDRETIENALLAAAEFDLSEAHR